MSGNNNLNRNANEGKTIRNTNPVNMSGVPDNLLKAASPNSFNLLHNTKINKDSSDAAAAACRSYTDITGLRRLQKDQVNMTYYDPRCGWRYKPSNGIIPEINQAALGTAAGPSFGEPGSPDEVVGGAQWFWDLESADRIISAKICQNASKCKQLSMLGRYTDLCGYCKTTGAIIPTEVGSARFPNDTTFRCLKKDIITSSGTCPEENFTNFRQGNLKEVFKVREGFGTLDSLNNCMEMPMSKDCVIRAAQNAGCSSDGALIRALNDSTGGSYDSKLTTNAAYSAYSSFSPFSPGLMQNGSVASINIALNDFGSLMGNMQSTNPKIALAARDLCKTAGEFDTYDFCTEMNADTIINANNISCVQKVWEQRGGTKQGTQKPTVAILNGKKFGDFMMGTLDYLLKNIDSNDKNVNVDGIMSVFGSDTSSRNVGTPLPINDNTCGAETVWFDLGNVRDAEPKVVILKCDLRLRKDTSTVDGPAGEVLPFITTGTDLVSKYNFTNPNNKAYTSAFEIRITDDTSVNFGITTDDGFMLSKIQNLFEDEVGGAGEGTDWGSWKYQGPTRYESPPYSIGKDQPNIFITKWFQGYGEAASQFWIYRPKTNWIKGALSPDVHLTQEPLAPWCRYEVCERKNNGSGKAVGLFERRWNGPSGLNEQGKSTPGFDVTCQNVTFIDKMRAGKYPYAIFNRDSFWTTKAHFSFKAFKTITISMQLFGDLERGETVRIFNYDIESYTHNVLYLSKGANGVYQFVFGDMKVTLGDSIDSNKRFLLVIQFVETKTDYYGMTRALTLDILHQKEEINESECSAYINALAQSRNISYFRAIISREDMNSNKGKSDTDKSNCGTLTLGSKNTRDEFGRSQRSFSGMVYWLHGFRNYLDTADSMKKEITGSWLYRYPIDDVLIEEKNRDIMVGRVQVLNGRMTFKIAEYTLRNGNSIKTIRVDFSVISNSDTYSLSINGELFTIIQGIDNARKLIFKTPVTTITIIAKNETRNKTETTTYTLKGGKLILVGTV